ncbi:MAG TPA: DUF481 domain-containing protein [Acidobacteriota bacterium]|nr:DUF481 domain-containing protein [Acidobacteriota bacterium]
MRRRQRVQADVARQIGVEMFDSRWKRAAALCLFSALVFSVPALAQDVAGSPPSKAWTNEAQIALVNASGNSTGTTLAVTDRFTINGDYSEIIIFGEIYRATSTQRSLTNRPNGTVRESLISEATAQRYEFGVKYRQNFMGNTFWYLGGDWFRDRPAGIANRLTGHAGLGIRFLENARASVVGEAGVGLTRETQVSAPLDNYVAGRLGLDVSMKLSSNSELTFGGEFLADLQHTTDYRFNGRAAITAHMSELFALRISGILRTDNVPPVLVIDSVPENPPAPYIVGRSDRLIIGSVVMTF